MTYYAVFVTFVLCVILETASRMRRREKELKQQLLEKNKQLASLYRILWSYRDIWDHLPDYLPMSEDRKNLAWELGTALVKLPVPIDAKAYYKDKWQWLEAERIDPLVKAINDPTLNKLWEEGSYLSMYEMLRALLFQTWMPEFDLHAGWA